MGVQAYFDNQAITRMPKLAAFIDGNSNRRYQALREVWESETALNDMQQKDVLLFEGEIIESIKTREEYIEKRTR